MQFESYIQAVSDDLARVAAVGDESTARAAELLAVALESSLARRLQEALAEAALELSAHLDHGRIELRVAGIDPELVYVGEPEQKPSEVADEANCRTAHLAPARKPESPRRGRSRGHRRVRQHLARASGWPQARVPSPAGNSWRLTGYGRS